MSQRHASIVIRTAATPAAAKVLVALLQAEGIPASVDGDSLADEVAMSTRLMNLAGVRVRIPAAARERAEEILANVAVPDDELEAQAIAGTDETPPRPRPQPQPKRYGNGTIFLAALLAAAATAVVLEIEHDAKALYAYEPLANGWRELMADTGETIREVVDEDQDGVAEEQRMFERGRVRTIATDKNQNGIYESQRTLGDDGRAVSIARDLDEDGRYEELEEFRGPQRLIWRDTTGDGFHDLILVLDDQGTELRRQRWTAAGGFAEDR